MRLRLRFATTTTAGTSATEFEEEAAAFSAASSRVVHLCGVRRIVTNLDDEETAGMHAHAMVDLCAVPVAIYLSE